MEIERLGLLLTLVLASMAWLIYQVAKDKEKVKIWVYRLWHGVVVSISGITLILLGYQMKGVFQIHYVYEHTAKDLDQVYRLSALWAGKEGSFLVWALILSVMGYSVLGISYKTKHHVFTTYGLVTLVLIIMSFISNPFKRMEIIPVDGMGLNTALQDPWMAVHPPLVFIGYTAMAILFALGIAGVTLEKLMKKWIRLSLIFLGLGIMTGSVWAYRALGWGGYWAWDAIENIALVPWLLLCAYGHGKTTMSKVKCILPFAIAAFGTFLVRSGLLGESSAHGYISSTSHVAKMVLVGMVIATVSMILYTIVRHLHGKKSIERQDVLSYFRWGTYGYAAIILVATVLPLLVDYTVPLSFYNQLTLVYVLFNGILLLIYERRYVGERMGWTMLIGVVLTMFLGKIYEYSQFTVLLVLWVILTAVIGYLLQFPKKQKVYYYCIHLLFLTMVIGGIVSSSMGSRYMKPVETMEAISMMDERKTMIRTGVMEDYIVDEIVPSSSGEGSVMIYGTKPLILLFWVGSFGVLAVVAVKVIQESILGKKIK